MLKTDRTCIKMYKLCNKNNLKYCHMEWWNKEYKDDRITNYIIYVKIKKLVPCELVKSMYNKKCHMVDRIKPSSDWSKNSGHHYDLSFGRKKENRFYFHIYNNINRFKNYIEFNFILRVHEPVRDRFEMRIISTNVV